MSTIDEMREYTRKLREMAADPDNDHFAVSLRESAQEWDRITDRLERGEI